jgi:hypothetical protein
MDTPKERAKRLHWRNDTLDLRPVRASAGLPNILTFLVLFNRLFKQISRSNLHTGKDKLPSDLLLQTS